MSTHRRRVPQPDKMCLEQGLMIFGDAQITLLRVKFQSEKSIHKFAGCCRNDEVAEHLGLTSGKKKRSKSRRRYAAA